MNIRKFLVTPVLVFGILLASAACGASGTQNTDSTGGETAASSSTTQADSPGDPFGKYETPIDMDVTMTAIDGWMALKEGQTAEDNIWTRTYRDELGINVNVLWTTTSDQWEQKVNLMIASDDLPDMFAVNRKQFEQLYAAGKLEDLTASYNKYASPYVRENIYNELNQSAIDAVTKEEKLLGLPWNLDYVDSAGTLWIRTDWLKKLDLPEPKTIDELENVARAFMSNNVNNGKPADYGILFTKDFAHNSLFNAFHTYMLLPDSTGFFTDVNGKLVDSKLGPEMRAALLRLQKWYKEGIIPKDFGVIDAPKGAEDLASSKVGIKFGGVWDSGDWTPAKKQDASADIKSIPIPTVDGTPAKTGIQDVNIQSIWVVRKGYEHPEAAIKLLNIGQKYLYDPETLDTINYSWDLEGNNPWCYTLIYLEPMRKNYDIYIKCKEAFQNKDTSKLTMEQKISYDQILQGQQGDTDQWYAYKYFGPTDSSFTVAEYYLDNNLFLPNLFRGMPTPTMLEKGPTLDKMFREMMTRVIMGDDISEFDKYVEKIQNLGQAEIEKEVNEWYAANK